MKDQYAKSFGMELSALVETWFSYFYSMIHHCGYFILTMPLAQHRSLVTDNHWSISGKQVVFTLSIDIGMYLKGPSKYSEKLARKLKHCIWSKTSIQTIEIDQGPKRIEEQSMIETKD